MSQPGARRWMAEIPAEPGAIACVGNRPLPHFWPMLSAYFRDVLLPPQRRADASTITWSWQQRDEERAPSSAELASVRKRLLADQQLLAENLEATAADATAMLAGADGLGAAMQRVVSALAALPDESLARFACRTEAGLRLHSWGAAAPGVPGIEGERNPDVGGLVVAGGRPVRGCEVRLLRAQGEIQARARTNREGRFRFASVAAGNYRVQAGRSVAGGEMEIVVESAPLPDMRIEIARAPRRVGAWVAAGMTVVLAALAAVRFSLSADTKPAAVAAERAVSEIKGPPKLTAPREAAVGPAAPRRVNSSPPSSLAPPTDATPARGRDAQRAPGASDAAAFDERPRVAASALGAGTQGGLPRAEALPITAPAGESAPRAVAPAVPGAGVAASTVETGGAAGAVDVTPPTPPSPAPSGSRSLAGPRPEPAPPARSAPPRSADAEGTFTTKTPEMGPAAAASAKSLETPATTNLVEPPLLPRVSRVRFAPWRLELLRDAILPTQPIRSGGSVDLAALRAAYWASQHAALPRALREGAIRVGIRLETPASAELQWRANSGDAALVTRHEPGATELLLPETPGPFAVVLLKDGAVAAALRFDPADNVWTLRAAAGIAPAWFFAAAREPGAEARLSWRQISGEMLPAAAALSQTAAESRVSFAASPAEAKRFLAYFDRETGWALVGGMAEVHN